MVCLAAFHALAGCREASSRASIRPRAHGVRLHFVGLDNYAVDARAIRSSGSPCRTISGSRFGTIPVSICAGACSWPFWVNDRIAGRTWVRMAFFTPTVLPMIAVANIWLFFFTPQYGLFEQISALFGGHAQNWLGSKETALSAVIDRGDLEGGRVLHDLLPRRAADHLTDARRSGGARGRIALGPIFAACNSRS